MTDVAISILILSFLKSSMFFIKFWWVIFTCENYGRNSSNYDISSSIVFVDLYALLVILFP
jgi:hypothetical protein